ncbi:DUF4169 family protein, partial [Acinetobacter baumannii]
FRKQRERQGKQEQAAENRVLFGRTREERERNASVEEMRRRVLDGAKIDEAAGEPKAEAPEAACDLDPGAVS